MNELTLDQLSAKFEVAFLYIENENTGILDRLDNIDVFADYLYPRSDEDYDQNGDINHDGPAFAFIERMIDNYKDCRKIVQEELEEREEYELLTLVTEPLSKEVQAIVSNLNIFE